MLTVILKVELNCCRGCRSKIYNSLMGKQGVTEVSMDKEGGKLTVKGERLESDYILSKVKKVKRCAEFWPSEERVIKPSKDSILKDCPNYPSLAPPKLSCDPSLAPPKLSPPPAAPPPPPPPGIPQAPTESRKKTQARHTYITERCIEDSTTKIHTRVETKDAYTRIEIKETHIWIDKCTTTATRVPDRIQQHNPEPKEMCTS